MAKSPTLYKSEVMEELMGYFDRVFRICLGFSKNPWDAEELMQELGEFVADVKGIKIDVTGKKSIGFVADAIAQGILNLHIYLDTKKEREKLMQELEKKFEAEAKKVKKEKMNCE